VTSFLAQ